MPLTITLVGRSLPCPICGYSVPCDSRGTLYRHLTPFTEILCPGSSQETRPNDWRVDFETGASEPKTSDSDGYVWS